MIKQSINYFKQTEKIRSEKTAGEGTASVSGSGGAGQKIFSASDLWNIQRNGKMFLQRRWMF